MTAMMKRLRKLHLAGYVFVGGKWKKKSSLNLPYHVMMDNGINFSKSIHNPKSVIRRLLKVVDENPEGLPKVEILRLMGYPLNRKVKMVWVERKYPQIGYWPEGYPKYDYDAKPVEIRHYKKTVTNHPDTTRGYLSWYFTAARIAGFVAPVRRGRSTVWVKGPAFPRLDLIINL